ncbi:MAG TPA: YkgJ family cysteine cluster protein [Candidatus Thermoplasmatota archaeon]|nr:YkgJ family cysteine cluster protein [Candidatus Thermoplasmatota archaeon]
MSLRSPCVTHGCAACCYDTEMPLTEDDIRRLEALGHDRAAFVAWSAEGTAQLATRAPDDAAAPGRPCFFLKANACSVYADRPQGCRIYPLVLNEHGRLLRDDECPHRGEFALDAGAKRRIQRVLSNLARRS